MMTEAARTNALTLLRNYSHHPVTNPAKGRLSNRDALAVLFARLGPMTLAEARDLMMEWRLGKATYRTDTYTGRYNYRTNEYDAKYEGHRRAPAMSFSYCFNASTYGGYGCVGQDHMSRGHHMHSGYGGICRVQAKVPGETFFRRTYWYRTGKGTYAPTVECMRRVRELGLG